MVNIDAFENGQFITIHGIDGVGKTSVARLLTQIMRDNNVNAIFYDDLVKTEKKIKDSFTKKVWQGSVIMNATIGGQTVIRDRWLIDNFADAAYNKTDTSNIIGKIIKPDISIILLCDEKVRQKRLMQKDYLDDRDLMIKTEGSRPDFFEKYLIDNVAKFSSNHFVVDTTSLNIHEAVGQIISELKKIKCLSAFDNEKYYNTQIDKFLEHLYVGDQQIIEIGGKPFGDNHAARVLPGYKAHNKAKILKDLIQKLDNVKIVMALGATDILAPPDGTRIHKRIRGDSGLTYDDEVIRLVKQAKDDFDIKIDTVVLTKLPEKISPENNQFLQDYKQKLADHKITVKTIRKIANYPNLSVEEIVDALTRDEPISYGEHLIVVSPGGGSGKFGVVITELAHALKSGRNPNFIKFETFPVFKLPIDHPLNLAFLAATADLPNLLAIETNGQTDYDKDDQNFQLMKNLVKNFPDTNSPLKIHRQSTDFGVNVIETGIVDDNKIAIACYKEIIRRIERYRDECETGIELLETLDRTEKYFKELSRRILENER